MKRQDVAHIIDAPMQSLVSYDGKTKTVVGKMGEAYNFGDGHSYAHILSLEGQQEIGAECRGDDWYVFHSRYMKTVQYANLIKFRRVLNEIEEGEIERDYECGDIGWGYMSYVFGTIKSGRGIFLGIRGDVIDVWVNYTPEKVEVKAM